METGDKVLISTSRKPSQKTRTFCKNLSHAFGFDYTNRGKSYQIKGNPSKLTFYDLKAQEKLALLISANEMNERLNIDPENLKIKSNVPELDILAEVLGFELSNEPLESNYLRISYADYDDEKNFAIIYFVNSNGEQLDLQINVKKVVDS